MNTARVTHLDLAEDGVLIVRATCETCRKTVTHGAGTDLNAPLLGHRASHCRCDAGGYELVDPHRIVPLRLRVIRQDVAEREALRAEIRAARREAQALREAATAQDAR